MAANRYQKLWNFHWNFKGMYHIFTVLIDLTNNFHLINDKTMKFNFFWFPRWLPCGRNNLFNIFHNFHSPACFLDLIGYFSNSSVKFIRNLNYLAWIRLFIDLIDRFHVWTQLENFLCDEIGFSLGFSRWDATSLTGNFSFIILKVF